MKAPLACLLTGLSLTAFSAPAAAQDANTPDSGKTDKVSTAAVEEIVVTARRKTERLQDVPQTVDVVSGEKTQDLAIVNFTDISTVVPGLNLVPDASGFNANASTRGVSSSSTTGASSTVQFYLNDSPIDQTFIFQSMFDIDGVEVLQGPQGTIRGVSAPSGAITIQTHKPDLEDYGGYAEVIASQLGSQNEQLALNVPIIKDKLAVRFAGVYDGSDFDGTKSVNSSQDPSDRTQGERITFAAAPIEDVDATLTLQHLRHHLDTFPAVQGPGAGINGPNITADDRLGVVNELNDVNETFNLAIWNVNWTFGDNKLSYIANYSHTADTVQTPQDFAGQFPGQNFYEDIRSTQAGTSQEIRLSSYNPEHFFDYTVGFFYQQLDDQVELKKAQVFYGLPNLNTNFPIAIASPQNSDTISGYGGFTVRPDSDDEITGSMRYFVNSQHDATVGNIILPTSAPPSARRDEQAGPLSDHLQCVRVA